MWISRHLAVGRLGRAALAFAALAVLAAAPAVSAAEQRKAGEVVSETKVLTAADGRQVRYEIGAVFVPENRDAKTSRIIAVGFTRLRPAEPTEAPPMFVLPGGPGDSYLGAFSETTDRARRQQAQLLQLSRAGDVVVIDHHRRGEEFIEDPVLVYMEPYASSTSELVTELIEYQAGSRKLSILEATSLLAGIMVDTKGFTLRTGSRTFDAASFLRAQGADTILVQHFMRQDLDAYIEQSQILRNTEMYADGMAIAVAPDDEAHHQVLIAQSADQLLNMEGVKASFVIAILPDGRTGISARSLGDVNVQVIMEMLDGGGHLTNAATQLEVSREQAKVMLKEAIDHYLTDETEGEELE